MKTISESKSKVFAQQSPRQINILRILKHQNQRIDEKELANYSNKNLDDLYAFYNRTLTDILGLMTTVNQTAIEDFQ